MIELYTMLNRQVLLVESYTTILLQMLQFDWPLYWLSESSRREIFILFKYKQCFLLMYF